MSSGISFIICSIFYSLLLIAVYFSKRRLKSFENKIYISLIITNFVGLLLELANYFTVYYIDQVPITNLIISRLYLSYLITWITLFTSYIFVISIKNFEKSKKTFLPLIIFYLFTLIIINNLPLYYHNADNVIYSYGPSVIASYVISSFHVIIWIICMLLNLKNIKNKKLVPMFAYMILGIVVAAIQASYPSMLLITSMQTFITCLMYFTIENPDLKLINELNIAKDQAEKANNAKTEFLSNMSHEIRTPLNAIVGFSQALIEEEIPESAKEEVKDIMMASDNLLELVNGILDISKIEANKLEIVNTEYQFNKILNELVTLTKARIGEKPIEFRTNFDPSIPQVLYGDYTRLKQIILNLLTNAAKYTKEGFIEFTVSCCLKGDICRLIISVQDSGIGIEKDKIDKLFTKFERLDVEKHVTIEGTGLGLAITKKLVDLMQGSIVVQSHYGEGSNFTVAIDQKIVTTNASQIIELDKSSNVSYFDLSDKKILLVDDNKVNLKVAERLLKNYHVQLTSCISGIECLKQLEKETYDLILLDDMMPGMSGSETLKTLKKDPNFQIPTVALTANAITGMREQYLKEGFDGYLAKPIQKEELNQILRKFLKGENT